MSDRPPMREVVRARDFKGPKGAQHFAEELECGRIVWHRAKRPRQRVQCVMCWFEREKTDADDC